MILEEYLPAQIFSFMIVLVRIAGLVMTIPAYGERSVPTRVKIALAALISLVLWPLVRETVPPEPKSVPGLGMLILTEALIGIVIGLVLRFSLMILSVTGMVISMHTGLGFAQAFDPGQGSQGAIISSLLAMLGITLIFISDLHLMLIEAMYDSYEIFPPGAPIPIADVTQAALNMFSDAFVLGIQLAGPFIAFSLIFYLGLGIVARLSPQLQVFFVAMPANIMLGLTMFALLLPTLLLWYLETIEEHFALFIR